MEDDSCRELKEYYDNCEQDGEIQTWLCFASQVSDEYEGILGEDDIYDLIAECFGEDFADEFIGYYRDLKSGEYLTYTLNPFDVMGEE